MCISVYVYVYEGWFDVDQDGGMRVCEVVQDKGMRVYWFHMDHYGGVRVYWFDMEYDGG